MHHQPIFLKMSATCTHFQICIILFGVLLIYLTKPDIIYLELPEGMSLAEFGLFKVFLQIARNELLRDIGALTTHWFCQVQLVIM
jgi:hypothetical protein